MKKLDLLDAYDLIDVCSIILKAESEEELAEQEMDFNVPECVKTEH